jgi:hypothetical protein
MGSEISTVRAQLKSADEKEETHQKEQLEFLVVAANAKLDKYQSILEALANHCLSRISLLAANTPPHM